MPMALLLCVRILPIISSISSYSTMKRIFLCLSVMGALYTNTANACTICGCPAGSQYMGLLPQTTNNFVGLKYQYRGFSSFHPEDGVTTLPGTSYEHYNTVQVWGRYALSNRVQLYAMVPYIMNYRTQEGASPASINGVGDVTVLASYRAVNYDKKNWKHTLLVGGGAKMPTGAHEHGAFTEEDGLPNMQPGTHAWDAVAYANYTIQRKNIGLNLDASYAYAMSSHDGYKFGNRTSAGLLGFYQLQKGKLTVLPQVGMRYDLSTKDYENYDERLIDEDSGGWQLFVSQGVQAYYGKVGAHITCYEPVGEHFASGLVTTRFKAEAGVMVLF
jgi:hypothetical protein